MFLPLPSQAQIDKSLYIMASFDFVEAVSKGYKFIWEERVAVLSIALMPFVIKVLTFFAVTAFVDAQNFMRHGLLLLPCLLYTSPSPRDQRGSRMPSSA